jgi:aspartate kinase
MTRTVAKIGGTSMNDYAAIRNNIIFRSTGQKELYQRAFVVSAYGGITDLLLEHKKSGEPGVYALFADAEEGNAWSHALDKVEQRMLSINKDLFPADGQRRQADAFILHRLRDTRQCLTDLERLCQHGHFAMDVHLSTVREMLASLGEAHSAWNMAFLLSSEGLNARFVDLTGWDTEKHLSLDERIQLAFMDVDFAKELPVVTGYAHCSEGLMTGFDRGYSEMTFSRLAVLTQADEAVIYKEYHLSSADPAIVGVENAVPIGRTNYDVADQLANLGMEAIHPRAAKGLRRSGIPLRVMNTFEPEHYGTLITGEYVSETPRVEIIAGRENVYALELFDQDMVGNSANYYQKILSVIGRFKATIITIDTNANTITHYLAGNLKTIKRIQSTLEQDYPECELSLRKVSIVSAIGSDMKIPGMLAKTVAALADSGISVLAMHQSMRQVDMQFVVDSKDYKKASQSLHQCMIEVHDHGPAICAARPLAVTG